MITPPGYPDNKPKILPAWLYDTHLGDLMTEDQLGKNLCFRYTPEAIARWGLGSQILSAALPITDQPYYDTVTSFFSGLLPEGAMLSKLARDADLAETDIFNLLAIYGKDVAGALTISTNNQNPARQQQHHSYQKLTDEQLSQLILDCNVEPNTNTVISPLGNTTNNYGRSLGGYQGKLLVARFDDQWFLPLNGSPSTHIIKPLSLNRHFPDLTEVEIYAQQLAEQIGLTSTKTRLHDLDGLIFMSQTRYDRQTRDAIKGLPLLSRIHQEDGTQATGHKPTEKYLPAKIADVADGPSLKELSDLYDNSNLKIQFFKNMLFKTLIGDVDAHAKNYSWLHYPDETITVTPIYDTSPRLHRSGHNLAIAINDKTSFDDLTYQDIITEVSNWGLDPIKINNTIIAMATKITEAMGIVPVPPGGKFGVKSIEENIIRLTEGLNKTSTKSLPKPNKFGLLFLAPAPTVGYDPSTGIKVTEKDGVRQVTVDPVILDMTPSWEEPSLTNLLPTIKETTHGHNTHLPDPS